mmetsp:Transcript_37880/g.61089  ORF Transcript_37880/g.61089 Transcript_37880/m.61089 type:complete len:138 (-) Transcript_37880:756-1169(-)
MAMVCFYYRSQKNNAVTTFGTVMCYYHVCVCVRVCVCTYAYVCVCACVCVRAVSASSLQNPSRGRAVLVLLLLSLSVLPMLLSAMLWAFWVSLSPAVALSVSSKTRSNTIIEAIGRKIKPSTPSSNNSNWPSINVGD